MHACCVCLSCVSFHYLTFCFFITRAVHGLVSEPINPESCDLNLLHDSKNSTGSINRPERLVWEIPDKLGRSVAQAHETMLQVYCVLWTLIQVVVFQILWDFPHFEQNVSWSVSGYSCSEIIHFLWALNLIVFLKKDNVVGTEFWGFQNWFAYYWN